MILSAADVLIIPCCSVKNDKTKTLCPRSAHTTRPRCVVPKKGTGRVEEKHWAQGDARPVPDLSALSEVFTSQEAWQKAPYTLLKEPRLRGRM